MKKVIGLCLVVLLSSTSVFARENRRMDKRKMDPSARCEKIWCHPNKIRADKFT